MEQDLRIYLVEVRIAKGVSQEVLSKAMGISQPYLAKMEKGKMKISKSRLRKWLDTLNEFENIDVSSKLKTLEEYYVSKENT